jgi:DUF4097 and DUF4098 domain-containing protein YvlB
VTGTPKVSVHNRAPGSVEVKPGVEGEVSITLDLRRPEYLDWHISQDGDSVTVTCRSTTSSFFDWPMHLFSRSPRANIIISTPEHTDVNVENHVGRVEINGVKGSVTVESSTGAMSLRSVAGVIKVRTKTGSLNLDEVDGTISARSVTGSIRFSGTISKGENWFRTMTGSIRLTLKREPNLSVEARTRLGRIECTPELADAHYERGKYIGHINEGAGRLIAETRTGNIRINH